MGTLQAESLTVAYKNHVVLHDITFTIEKGDYVAIVGPNGAGKTSLVRALLGLNSNVTGKIKCSTKKVAYLQQKIALADAKFPASVREIIRSGLLINKKFPRLYNKEDNKAVATIVEEVGIASLLHRPIGDLSGGELQKVLLARALVSKPEILFLDEPTTALDPTARNHFYSTIQKLNENQKVTIVLISHDVGTVGLYAKKLMYIDRSIVFYGNFEEFCHSAKMTNYFGEVSQHFICQRHHTHGNN